MSNSTCPDLKNVFQFIPIWANEEPERFIRNTDYKSGCRFAGDPDRPIHFYDCSFSGDFMFTNCVFINCDFIEGNFVMNNVRMIDNRSSAPAFELNEELPIHFVERK